MNNFKDKLMNNKKLIIAGIAVLAVVIAVICIAVATGNKDAAKGTDKNAATQEEVILPDVLLPKNTTYVTEKTDTAITVEGYISTPAEENPMPDSIDDPDYIPPEKPVSYIYKSHTHKFDDNGNMFIEIEYEKTTDTEVSTEFSITVEDEKLAESPAVFITCNGHVHKVWQA